MERGRPPYCGDCLVPLTVMHILVECPSYRAERLRHFPMINTIQGDNERLVHMLAETTVTPYDFNPVKNYINDLNIVNKV